MDDRLLDPYLLSMYHDYLVNSLRTRVALPDGIAKALRLGTPVLEAAIDLSLFPSTTPTAKPSGVAVMGMWWGVEAVKSPRLCVT